MVALRHSVPILFLQLDDTYNEIWLGKKEICQGIIKEIHIPDWQMPCFVVAFCSPKV